MKRLSPLLLLVLASTSSFAMDFDWGKFMDGLWAEWLEASTPLVMVEATTGVDRPKRFQAWDDSGRIIADFSYKFNYTKDLNLVTSGDSTFYSNESQTVQFYSGLDREPWLKKSGIKHVKIYEGKTILERYTAYGYPSQNWKKEYTYKKDELLEKTTKWGEDSTANPVEIILLEYNSDGSVISEHIETNFFGSAQEKEITYEYNEDGLLTRQYEETSYSVIELKYFYEDKKLIKLEYRKGYEPGEYTVTEIADFLYDDSGRLLHMDVQSLGDYYMVDFTYEEGQALPVRSITEFSGTTRTYNFDNSYQYLWEN